MQAGLFIYQNDCSSIHHCLHSSSTNGNCNRNSFSVLTTCNRKCTFWVVFINKQVSPPHPLAIVDENIEKSWLPNYQEYLQSPPTCLKLIKLPNNEVFVFLQLLALTFYQSLNFAFRQITFQNKTGIKIPKNMMKDQKKYELWRWMMIYFWIITIFSTM